MSLKSYEISSSLILEVSDLKEVTQPIVLRRKSYGGSSWGMGLTKEEAVALLELLQKTFTVKFTLK